MAKYEITMSCGHEETVTLFGRGSERERKIEWYKDHGLCKECYKKQMQAKAEKEGLVFNASPLPYIDRDGNILVSVWFSGNTMPHKDEIKSLGGYRWSEKKSADSFLSLKRPSLCWNKQIRLDDLETEAKKAESIGANKFVADDGFWSNVNLGAAMAKQREWKEKKGV